MSTAFQIRQNGKNLVCKNQDVIYDGVYLFTNQRGIAKKAMIMPPAEPVSWVSAYGSITVSQIGKENPNGGMNEAGLVVEQTTLWQTEYPAEDERPVIGELQWIQYLLDTCGSVKDMLAKASSIRIGQNTSQLHYIVVDRTGERAIIEFLKGEMIVHSEGVSIPVMANTAYADSIEAFHADSQDWIQWEEYQRNSMERFSAVASRLHAAGSEQSTIDFAFDVLQTARREDTVFSLVYDTDRLEIHATSSRNPNRKRIQLGEFDFDQDMPGKAADLQELHAEQGSNNFHSYTSEINLKVVSSFFRDPVLTSIFKWEISEEMLHYLAHYPDTFVKASKQERRIT